MIALEFVSSCNLLLRHAEAQTAEFKAPYLLLIEGFW